MSTLSETTGLAVHERGPADGPRAVLIHSTGTSGADLLDRFGLAVPGFHVLAPDRTNYGTSRRAELALVADDAEDVATLLGDGAHLFGYSYGAVVALKLAATHPTLVRSLTLLEAPAFQLLPDDPAVTATLARIRGGIDGRSEDAGDYFAAFMSSAFGDTFRVPLDLVPVERKAAAMREQRLWEADLDLAPLVAAAVPTLVICGDWDPGFTAVSEHLAAVLRGHLLRLDGATHFFDGRWPAIRDELEAFWRSPTTTDATGGTGR